MNKCLIRVDGNSMIGTGHQMRCLAIAKELQKSCEVVFVVADEENAKVLQQTDFAIRVLNSKWDDMELELENLTSVIKEENAQLLLIDSYQVTDTYLKELKKLIKIAYIDDLHQFQYSCDLLMNYSIFAEKYNYAEEYFGTDTQFMLGCDFAPLAGAYQNLPQKQIVEVKKVLVLTGGTDAYHFALQFVKRIASRDEFHGIQFYIVCGRYNMDIEEIRAEEVLLSNVHVLYNVVGLSEWMRDADIAISAGGTTLYELAACGTPTIAYILADNQIENVETFAQKEYVVSVGDVRPGFPEEKLVEILHDMQGNAVRQQMSRKMQQLVDGRGCYRIVEKILQLKMK